MNDARPTILISLRTLVAGVALAFTTTMVVVSAAHADDKKPAPSSTTGNKGSSKRTTINFEDQLVEGQTQKPELFYLLQQRNNNFKRLIRLRENFLPEMRKTSEDISHSAGKGTDE